MFFIRKLKVFWIGCTIMMIFKIVYVVMSNIIIIKIHNKKMQSQQIPPNPSSQPPNPAPRRPARQTTTTNFFNQRPPQTDPQSIASSEIISRQTNKAIMPVERRGRGKGEGRGGLELGRFWVVLVVVSGVGFGVGILGLVWGSLAVVGSHSSSSTVSDSVSSEIASNKQDHQSNENTKNLNTTPGAAPTNTTNLPTTITNSSQPTPSKNSTNTTIITNSTNSNNSINTINSTILADPWIKFEFVLQDAPLYTNIWKVMEIQELPFCVFVEGEDGDKIVDSITQQNYTNYVIHLNVLTNTNTSNNPYLQYKQLIHKKCTPNTLLLFLNQPLPTNTLQSLNLAHQKYFTWATYSRTSDSLQVYSFYSRIFDLIGSNDFQGDNLKYMDGMDSMDSMGRGWRGNFGAFLGMVVVELCEYHMKKIEGEAIGSSFLTVSKDQWKMYSLGDRTRYTRIYKLSQDFKVDINQQQYRWSNLKTIKKKPNSHLTPQKMHLAVHRQQLPYLPTNHSLNALQYIQSCSLFQIDKYQSPSQQVPFCVTILSHNNIAQNRYRKAMVSVLQQKYENYRIVFIDDNSDDGNMEKTIEVVREMGQLGRVRFVQNRKRMYATYNIVNAALTYCGEDQMQLLLDGDDEIIGKHAFSIMNSAYQSNKNFWIIYSTFKSNLYTYGTSQPLHISTLLSPTNTRRSNHIIGPIRTWRTKLLYSIPLAYHQNQTGHWLDTVYDDAMQHSIIQRAGEARVMFVQEMLYQYNKQYGDNDDATQEKRDHRRQTYQWVLGLQPLKELKDLDNVVRDEGVMRELKKGQNTTYYQIFPK